MFWAHLLLPELIHHYMMLQSFPNPLETFPEDFLGKLCCVNISEMKQKYFVPIFVEWNTEHKHDAFTS